MNIALSIDWDFFFKEALEADWGHRENKFFEETMWSMRLSTRPELMKTCVPDNSYKTFWNQLRKLNLMPTVFQIAESHTFAYTTFGCLGKLDMIINFDAHADMKDLGNPPKYVTCENWLREVLRMRRKVTAIWIQPEFTMKFKPTPMKEVTLATRFMQHLRLDDLEAVITTLKDWDSKPNILLSFIARSGAWVPPWADKQFEEFLKLSKAHWMFADGQEFKIQREFTVPTKEQIARMERARKQWLKGK